MFYKHFIYTVLVCFLTACISSGPNPVDPYECINRKTHRFNMAFDATFLKPPAKLYKGFLPPFVRNSINNAYNNINMLPTVANDILQAQWQWAIKDTWRLIINTTFGIGGFVDVACTWGLPPHSNDLGLTFAAWGDKNSPYIVIPFLGPSTIRDGVGEMFNFTFFTPYPYIPSDAVVYTLLGVRYIDIRSQLLEMEKLMQESLDQYAFIRDAYLQRRNFLITGEQEDTGDLYVEDGAAQTYVEAGAPADYVEDSPAK